MDSLDMKKPNLFILNVLLFLTFDLMLLGAGVRTMDAGLTCPDWPLCFGKTVPDYHLGVYLEFIHRVIAGLVGILYLVFFIQVWRSETFKRVRLLSVVGLFFLIAQIIMGGLTVLKLLEAYIVTLHLTLATIFLLVLFVMKKKLLKEDLSEKLVRVSKTYVLFRLNITLAVLFIVVQIILGGLVASTYSGLVCIDFPTCNGQYFPPMVGPIAIQMFHRFGAYWLALLVSGIFIFSIFFRKRLGLSHGQRKLGVTIFLLVFTQMFVGILNLQFLMPALLSVLHLALALTLLLSTVNLFYKTR
jgi:cytochrome c oxidase assembly protein subunit 15